MTDHAAFQSTLEAAVRRHLGAPGEILELVRLTGGATKLTWSFVLAQVRRELVLAPAPADAERARLVSFLGHPGERDELNRELAARIRAGDIALDDPALLAHLRLSLVEALRINNPKWIGAPASADQ
ncbi:MAG TPA: DUF6285 domain-containing protein [Kofleriaceae bacterium]|nr:DUF6285 domain-containing protein [Kofleriaceae bacterium]